MRICGLAIFFLSLISVGEAQVADKILARISEEIITLSDQKVFRKQLQQNLVPKNLLFQVFPKKNLLKNKQKDLEFLISQKILLLSLQKKNPLFPLPEQEIQRALLSLKGNLSDKIFAQKLRNNHLHLTSLKNQIKDFLKIDFLIRQQIFSKINISESDIYAFYFNKTGKSFFKIFEYEFSSLFFPATNKESAKLFQKNLARLSFEEAAKKQSLKIKVSKLKSIDINPLMEKALKSLSISQVSPLIPLNNGFYILKLKWKTPVLTALQQKQKNQIQEQLFKKELKREMNKWFQEKKQIFFTQIFSQ